MSFWALTRRSGDPLVWQICAVLCPILCVVLAVMYAAPSDPGAEATTPRLLMRGEHAAVLLGATVIGPLAGLGVGVTNDGTVFRPREMIGRAEHGAPAGSGPGVFDFRARPGKGTARW
ncbi:hypothetical protein PS467_35785 [Streptomyces luomodiensis]|uniref:Uncharacterized protein n=1 Tax=Streptomyces luomodiensis TaxID=3026192 RepID=A0ABY9V666_9ACTN|nr:hypothetical protein [Streptomyces sp. SCA4-21]WNF00304.1 hypothetical protein PS467_35785 [Streptomyces sp. SCA4-21]